MCHNLNKWLFLGNLQCSRGLQLALGEELCADSHRVSAHNTRRWNLYSQCVRQHHTAQEHSSGTQLSLVAAKRLQVCIFTQTVVLNPERIHLRPTSFREICRPWHRYLYASQTELHTPNSLTVTNEPNSLNNLS